MISSSVSWLFILSSLTKHQRSIFKILWLFIAQFSAVTTMELFHEIIQIQLFLFVLFGLFFVEEMETFRPKQAIRWYQVKSFLWNVTDAIKFTENVSITNGFNKCAMSSSFRFESHSIYGLLFKVSLFCNLFFFFFGFRFSCVCFFREQRWNGLLLSLIVFIVFKIVHIFCVKRAIN